MKELIRKGKCNRCGLCCVGCENLIPPNICSVWDSQPEDRGCKIWPPHPFECPPYCSYHFFDAETGEEVLGYKNLEMRKLYKSIPEGIYGD